MREREREREDSPLWWLRLFWVGSAGERAHGVYFIDVPGEEAGSFRGA